MGQRENACRLAKTDSAAALQIAREIREPYRRAQAIAWVARYCDPSQVVPRAREALKVALSESDSYSAVMSSAWALRALIERDEVDDATEVLGDVLKRMAFVAPQPSRAEAANIVFDAVYPAGKRLWLPVLQLLLTTPHPPVHWRLARAIRDALVIIVSSGAESVEPFVNQVHDEDTRAYINRALPPKTPRPPRSFFG